LVVFAHLPREGALKSLHSPGPTPMSWYGLTSAASELLVMAKAAPLDNVFLIPPL
jgi:hypothetical protein